MKYLLMIYTSEAAYASLPAEVQNANWAAYGAFDAELAKRGIHRGGEVLMPSHTSTTVQVRNGAVLKTDGPFAETKEQFSGFYVIDCADLDEALEMAAMIPNARFGSIEVRPVMDTGQ